MINPYAALDQELSKPDPRNPYVAETVDNPYLAASEPSSGTAILDALKEQGRSLVQTGKYIYEGMPSALTGAQFLKDPATGLPLQRKLTSFERDQQLAEAGDKEAAIRIRRASTGAALLMSTVAAGRLASGFKTGAGAAAGLAEGKIPLTTRALRFLAAEATGGGVYGYIDPGDRTRSEAVVEDAITFPIVGSALHGAFSVVRGTARRAFGFLAGKSLSPEATAALKNVKTEAEAKKVAEKAFDFFEKLKPEGELTQPEIVATQAAAVEAAVKKIDIPSSITPNTKEGFPVPFPKITPEHRKVLKAAFGKDTPIYEATYRLMKDADTAEKYAKQKKIMEAMEAKLTPEQRKQLRMLDNAGWEEELAQAIESGDHLAAADIAITQAAEETPIREVLTEPLKTEHAHAAAAIVDPRVADRPEILAARAETRAVAEKANAEVQALAEQVKAGMEKDDVEALAINLTRNEKEAFEAVNMTDALPPGAEPGLPAAATDPRVLFSRASEGVRKLIEDEGGNIASRTAARAALGAGSYYSFEQVDTDEHGLLWNSSFRALGGFLALAAAMPGPRTAQWLKTNKYTSNILKWGDFGHWATQVGKEGAELWQSITSEARTKAVLAANDLRKLLAQDPNSYLKKPNIQLNNRFAYAVDEGPAAPEWHMLTPELQKEAASLKMANDALATQLKAMGLITNKVDNYFSHVLPKETYNAWQEQYQILVGQGNPAAIADFEKLRTVQTWAKGRGLPQPIENVAEAQAKHLIDVGKMVASFEARKFFEVRNLIQKTSYLNMPTGWREIMSMPGKMAPEDVATLLERINSPSFSIPLADWARGVMMKTIMIFPWEHGINLLRAQMAYDPTLRSYIYGRNAIKNSDPIVMEVAKYAELFKQPEMLNEAQETFHKMLEGLGLENLTHLQQASDRTLWEGWAPSVGVGVWGTEMKRWAAKTEYKFLRGSPEYEAAARKAGQLANDAMGKIPDMIQDPKLAAGMRLMLFSPAWLRTRMSIMAHAAGDLQKIMAGELDPRDATYLQYKMKSVAMGVAFTYILSKLWGKKAPEFNPNTTKLYASTGLYDDRGRELGVDLVGWWQDDLKLYNDPFTFIEHRMNPLLRATYQHITGRDVFGNELTGMERWENLLRQMGPLTAVPEAVIKTAKGEMTKREAVKSGSELLALGNVSSLPRYQDVLVAKYAEKILRVSGLPVHREDVYELSKYMKQNQKMSDNMYGSNVKNFIAYKRRFYGEKHPLANLWYAGKKLLVDTFNE